MQELKDVTVERLKYRGELEIGSRKLSDGTTAKAWVSSADGYTTAIRTDESMVHGRTEEMFY